MTDIEKQLERIVELRETFWELAQADMPNNIGEVASDLADLEGSLDIPAILAHVRQLQRDALAATEPTMSDAELRAIIQTWQADPLVDAFAPHMFDLMALASRIAAAATAKERER